MSRDIKFLLIVLLGLGIIGVLYHYNQRQNCVEESFNNPDSSSDYQTTAPPSNMTQNNISKGGYLSKEDQVELINDNPNVVKNTLVQPEGQNKCGDPSASEPMGQNEVFKSVSNFDPNSGPVGLNGNQLPNDCYPKDQLTPGELLPQDPNSKWAQVNPAGQGEVGDQNTSSSPHHASM